MNIILHKRPHIIRGHILQYVEKGKPYEVVDTYQKSRKIVDETGKEVWVSGAAFRKYFYEEGDNA